LYRNVSQLRIPTLLAWGTDDRVTPITGMGTARDLLRPAETALVHCGHMAPYERPTAVAEHLVAFITDTQRSTA
jgi:pimeloyl-ACP methyl ester carboxylesterase